jgi:glycosyltransferase involved in cell wall biosynthesis
LKKKVISIVLNNFKNDSRVLKENISLQNAGYDVRVVALHEEPLKEFDSIQTIPVHRIKLRSRNWSKHKLAQLLKYFEFVYKVVKLYKKSGIIHCNDLNALPIGVVIKKIFNRDAKIVYDAHEYEINDVPYQSKMSIKIKYYIERFLIKYADKVITVSNSIADEYVKLYGIEKPALVLNTPPYKEIEKKNIFRETFNLNTYQTIFLYQGGLSKGRGVEILLELFESLYKSDHSKDRNAVIIFMGYGPLENLIKETSKAYKNIYFHKAVSPSVLLDYTSSADFGITTIEDSCLSYRYCLPNKMFEYFMAEIPVIASNLYEMKRLIVLNKVGVVAKENTPEGLKVAINEALRLDKYELQRSIVKVKNLYNWEAQEKVILSIYGEL